MGWEAPPNIRSCGAWQPPRRGGEKGARVVDVVGFGDNDLAEVAVVVELLGGDELFVEAHGLADDELEAGAFHEAHQFGGILDVGAHRLGADDVLAGQQGGFGVLGVQVIRGVDADHLDVRARQ